MKVFGYLSSLVLLFMLVFNTNLMAQDDLYFDPTTDENFETVEVDEYGDSMEDEYVDDSFDDGDYYDDEFFYSRRIRRFNRSNNRFGYYDPWFTNNHYIDPFYYSNGPGINVVIGNGFYNGFYNPYNPYTFNPYGYNPYYANGFDPFFSPWGYNYNPYLDPCFNPYFGSYYGVGGNGFYGNNGYNPYSDYSYNPANFGPRRGTGGTVDAQGYGRTSGIKEGRNGANAEEETYFESEGGRTTRDLESDGTVRTIREQESTGATSVRGGEADSKTVDLESTKEEPAKTSRNNELDTKKDSEVKSESTRTTRSSRSSRADRPKRNPRSETRSSDSRSNSRTRSSSSRSNNRSSTRSSSSSRSDRSSSSSSSSSRSSRSSSSGGSSRSSRSNPR